MWGNVINMTVIRSRRDVQARRVPLSRVRRASNSAAVKASHFLPPFLLREFSSTYNVLVVPSVKEPPAWSADIFRFRLSIP